MPVALREPVESHAGRATTQRTLRTVDRDMGGNSEKAFVSLFLFGWAETERILKKPPLL